MPEKTRPLEAMYMGGLERKMKSKGINTAQKPNNLELMAEMRKKGGKS